jgi:aryl-alcohol dehydrogenase-like predicted oxidoreductase
LIEGFATPKGTKEYADQHSSLDHLELNHTDLVISQAGFGCYRVDISVEEHQRALTKALLEGINLIDTSSNYGDGGSEALVGAILERLIKAEKLSRESVVVVSKVGYLQGQNYQLSQERKHQGRPFPELVLYGEGLEHCIHPDFLEDQLDRSLERLKLESLDCYLLHNPEYYLGWAKRMGIPLEQARAEYYNRIRNAFQHLETEVKRGRIRYYGISSNTFPASISNPEFTSLERVWEIAESISLEHHFRIVQLPMNLYETGAVTERSQSDGSSVVQFARDKRIGVLINRPLNAISENTLFRLADVESVEAATASELERSLEELRQSEVALGQKVIPGLDLSLSVQHQVVEQVAAAEALRQHWDKLGTYERWRELQSNYFLPRIQSVLAFVAQKAGQEAEASRWVESHRVKVEDAFRAIASVYQEAAAEKSAEVKARVWSTDDDWAEARTLSQMAVRALRSTAGITAVLVGMRQESYVQDVLEELQRPVDRKDRTESWYELQNLGGTEV